MRRSTQKFNRAIIAIIGLAEFAYEDLRTFVADERKDESLRHFVWFRLYLSAQAHRAVDRYMSTDEEKHPIGFNGVMPVVFLRELPRPGAS